MEGKKHRWKGRKIENVRKKERKKERKKSFPSQHCFQCTCKVVLSVWLNRIVVKCVKSVKNMSGSIVNCIVFYSNVSLHSFASILFYSTEVRLR